MKFTTMKVPVLAIFANPKDLGNMMKDNPKARAAFLYLQHPEHGTAGGGL